MKKMKGLVTLISLAMFARILISLVISRSTLDQTRYKSEFHRYFDVKSIHSLPLERSREYCNVPGRTIKGLEGMPPSDNMKLLGAVVLLRHGDRLPISRPPAFDGHSVPDRRSPCKLDPNILPTSHLLRHYIGNISLYRRTIKEATSDLLHSFDLLPDTCSDVSITQSGIVQMLEIGQFLGRRYINQTLQKEASHRQEVAITTSRFARTFQSLLSFLFGLSPARFPEFISQKIASSSSLYFCDSDLSSDPSFFSHCNCPRAKQIPQLTATFRDWDTTRPSIAHIHKILKINEQGMHSPRPSIEKLNKIGPPPLSIASPSRIWDWLVSDYYCHGRPLPCVPGAKSSSQCLNSSLVEDLVHLVDKNHLRMVSDSNYIKATSLAMHPFLNAVNKKFHELKMERSRGTKSPFVWLLSGHDITIGPLFDALNMSLLTKVPYASRVAIELWTGCGKDGLCLESREPFVRILLNGVDVTRRLHLCGESSSVIHKWKMKPFHSEAVWHKGLLCPLSYFDQFVKSDFFKLFNSTDYNIACRL